MNDCQDYIHDLLAGFSSGTLDPEELEILTQLLELNPEWCDDIAALEDTMVALCHEFQVGVDPPLGLNGRIQTAVSSEPICFSPRVLRSWQRLASTIAAVLVLCLGGYSYQLKLITQQQQQIISLIQSPGSQIYVLRGNQKADAAQGSILINLEQQRVVMSFDNLPAAPAGSVYRLWSVVGSKTFPCRDDLLVRNGEVVDAFSLSPTQHQDLYDPALSGFIVTLEPAPTHDLKSPQGPIMMESI